MHNSIDAVGKMSEEEVKEYEKKTCPTCGSCSGMYTANSMNCLTEVLGMGLKGNGTIPAVYSERIGVPPAIATPNFTASTILSRFICPGTISL